MKPRVLFVGRTRYRLPLPDWQQKKFDALEEELDYRVLASAAASGVRSSGRFDLEPPGPAQLDGVLHHLRLPQRIRRAMREFEPDVIVGEDPPSAAAALLARGRRNSPKVVVEIHGDWRLATRLYGSPARRPLTPVADRVGAWAVRRADAVRALSPYTARVVEEVRGRTPDALFHGWSDLAVFSGPRKPLPARPTALFVGMLELYKGIDVLAEAWPRVAAELPEARLVVVGRGSRQPPSSAEHLEQLTPEEVAAQMDDSWVLVLPSRAEGLGRVLLESLARGRGVVATRAGGVVDVVQDGLEGLLVDPGDAAALAHALAGVLGDRPLAERLGEAAAHSSVRWQTTPEEFATRFRELVSAALRLGEDAGAAGL